MLKNVSGNQPEELFLWVKSQMFLTCLKLFFKVAHLENYLNSSLSPCTRYFVTCFCLLDVILSNSCLASFCSLGDFFNYRLSGLSASFTQVITMGIKALWLYGLFHMSQPTSGSTTRSHCYCPNQNQLLVNIRANENAMAQ